MTARPVTVFGGSGFLGRRIVEHLAAAGNDVRVAVRHPDRATFYRGSGRDGRDGRDGDGRIELVRADVWDEPTVARAVKGSASVINTVGQLRREARRDVSTASTDRGPGTSPGRRRRREPSG